MKEAFILSLGSVRVDRVRPGENITFAETLSGLERVGGQHSTLHEAAQSGFSVPHVSSYWGWRGSLFSSQGPMSCS